MTCCSGLLSNCRKFFSRWKNIVTFDKMQEVQTQLDGLQEALYAANTRERQLLADKQKNLIEIARNNVKDRSKMDVLK